ncbi:hypothetical protein KR093_010944, partial [Drosophila rubida]
TGEVFTITENDKKKIMKIHNVYRNMVAKGSFKLLPIAGRMLKLKWDENLAFIAEQAIKVCNLTLPDDAVFSTTYATQPSYNSAYNKYPDSSSEDEMKIAKSQIKAWFDQYRYVDLCALKSNKSKGGQEIGHFQRLMNGLNDRVGCAIIKYSQDKFKYQLMICFYGCHRMGKKMLYELGKVPGDKCKCGADHRFKNLCNKQERHGDCSLESGRKEEAKKPFIKEVFDGIQNW